MLQSEIKYLMVKFINLDERKVHSKKGQFYFDISIYISKLYKILSKMKFYTQKNKQK